MIGGTALRNNETIPSGCWDYNANKLLLRVQAYGMAAGPCVDGDTLIHTPEGYKKIRDIEPGDIVYSYNEELQILEEDVVVERFEFDIALFDNVHYYIHTKNTLVKAAWDHPFFVVNEFGSSSSSIGLMSLIKTNIITKLNFLPKNNFIELILEYLSEPIKLNVTGEYVIAKDLKVGQLLLNEDLSNEKITKIEIIPHFNDSVFDIGVKKNHNYFAGGVLVHNELSNSGNEWTCYDGDWQILDTNSGVNELRVYEEAMWWNITVEDDTCTYSSGTWAVNCADNCTISSEVDLGGDDITIIGYGTFTTSSDIINYGDLLTKGVDSSHKCEVYCMGGCFKT